jgi:hypothetical protein
MPKSIAVLSGARDLAQLAKRAQNSDEVVLFGCQVESLSGVEKLSKLRVLRVVCSTVSDLSALAQCAALEEVELVHGLAKDATPLLDAPKLHRARLLGNPWSKQSYEKVPAGLRKRKRPVIVEIDEAEVWELNQLFALKGLAASGATLFPRGTLFAIPGADDKGNVTLFTDWVSVIEEALKASKKKAVSLKELKAALPEAEFGASNDWRRFTAQYALGDQADAQEWLKVADLPEAYKADLGTFVKRFPKQLFMRFVDPKILDEVEEREKVKLPAWYRRTREDALASFYPEFDELEVRVGDRWLRLGPIGYHNNDRYLELFGKRGGLFPIVESDGGDAGLGYNLKKPNELTLYEYDETAMGAALDEKRSLTPAPGSSSYAALLAGADAVRVQGKEVRAVK